MQHGRRKAKTPFYAKGWFMWLMLVIIPPVGIVLLWLRSSHKQVIKIAITVVFFIWGWVYLGLLVGGETPESTLASVPTATETQTTAATVTTTPPATNTASTTASSSAPSSIAPSDTPTPTAEPTATPTPTEKPTATPKPTEKPTEQPTATPRPTAEPTAKETSNVSASYIGNINTKKFHRPTCHTLPALAQQVDLESRDAAISAGYDPCGNCDP